MVNVRILVDEALNDGTIVRPPNQRRSVNRLGEGTCQDEIPTAMGFSSEREMLLPKCRAPSYIVVNQCVLQQVVTHGEIVVPAAPGICSGWLPPPYRGEAVRWSG
jgi:hypothetical protein